ncbi:hypothetical protein TNCT_644851 [Trichonephila clavata]|uniref:Uncharacterized protein n=1 Tax=Trichonephila clavata TaxID=2740835 RepID=A0A8X6EZK7_TRICU|nr:hypothetical protein TNCT_644851 [Trichonephila clavata]
MEIGCSHGLAYSITHDRLNFRKVCARWVTRQLTETKNRMGIYFHLFGPQKQHREGKFADDDVQHKSPTAHDTATFRILCTWNWALIKRWDKCINVAGDHVEKLNCFQVTIMLNYFFYYL